MPEVQIYPQGVVLMFTYTNLLYLAVGTAVGAYAFRLLRQLCRKGK